jgi:hypothetical protein
VAVDRTTFDQERLDALSSSWRETACPLCPLT